MRIGVRFWVVILAFTISACGTSPTAYPFVVTPPAISVNITKDVCPSIEITPGMQIAWTNLDDVDRSLIIERVDAQGVIVDSGGIRSLQPGATFALTLLEEGQYTYYCSTDRKQFGTINVVPDTPVTAPSSDVLPTVAAGTSPCVETLIPATITEIRPAQPSAGSEITVIGSGGLIHDSCGGVNESARSFTLYLDKEPAGDFVCYVNHCELKLRLPSTLTQGSHCLSTQKDVCEFQFSVELQ